MGGGDGQGGLFTPGRLQRTTPRRTQVTDNVGRATEQMLPCRGQRDELRRTAQQRRANPGFEGLDASAERRLRDVPGLCRA